MQSGNLERKSMLNRIAQILLPRKILAMYKNYKTLSVEFGQYKTIARWDCVDKNDAPIPWYTYPAIEYLNQLDFSNKTVFEYGSGNSTRFWSEICEKLVSVEDNEEWYKKIKVKLPNKVDYHLLQEKTEFVQSIYNYPYKFDIILIDGSHRYECAVAAISKLRDDGFIILDNSDWEAKTSELLRKFDFIEVDMSGFGPINGYTWTTSFYFRRNVSLKTAHAFQPNYGIGSLQLGSKN